MSCEIRSIANIVDISAIRKCLYPEDDKRGSDNWLQNCKISVCPSGDLIVFANERRLVILSSKWDEKNPLCHYTVKFSGPIHESDNIKAVLCLPIVTETKTISSHAILDWVCILLGFESGFIRFYTENADFLFEEQLHNEIINSVKCQSQHNPRPDICPDLHPEEIYVQYQSNICVVQGAQIFPLLRIRRRELAKTKAKADLSSDVHSGLTNLNPRKWGFSDQAVINDVAVVGVNLHSTFDHLLTASACGGFDTKYRSAAPYNSLVLATGSRPFVGYHYALEGCSQPVLSDVAKAVASKLKSALPGWLTGSGSGGSNRNQYETKVTSAMQSPETMGCRFGTCDLRRTGQRLILSWDHKLAAISDDLGRVILMDAYRGVAIRIFKGHRDAQCAFIQVHDERLEHNHHHHHHHHKIKKHQYSGNKVALFLVIYSPKKATIDIFSVENGVKIATFTASKFSRLLYISYALMGFNTTSKSRYISQFNSVFIDNDGSIKEILIPFHFALAENNHIQSKDLHLFKKLKNLIKSSSSCDYYDEFFNILQQVKTIETIQQIVHLLLSSRKFDGTFLTKIFDYFTDFIDEGPDHGNQNSLKNFLNNCKKLLVFYQFLLNNSSIITTSNSNNDGSLNLDSKQLENLQKFLNLINLNNKSVHVKVKFENSDRMNDDLSASEFLSAFDLETNQLKLTDQEELGKFLFENYCKGQLKNYEILEKEISNAQINVNDLFALLIQYWLKRPLVNYQFDKLLDEMFYLKQLFLSLLNIRRDTVILWTQIREILTECLNPYSALIVAILCKIVANESEDGIGDDENEIEILTEENVEWCLLIGKLEDVSLLNIILSNQAHIQDRKHSTLPLLKYENHPIQISLKFILKNGQGCVSEFVAQWLTTIGLNPEYLLINEQLYNKFNNDNNDNDSDSNNSENDDDENLLPSQDLPAHLIEVVKNERIFNDLNTLRMEFPYSLDASILLTNMCWEYGLAWQKDIQQLDILKASTLCLKLIRNIYIKEGLYKMVWNTHLKLLFENTSKLINKVGKLPKERLCRQDTGFADYHLKPFFIISTEFFDNYMETIQFINSTPNNQHIHNKQLKFEEIWENSTQSLVQLTLQQSSINYNLLHLHYQLSLILELITSFPTVKYSKPINNLFEPYMMALFFVDIQTNTQINWEYVDDKIQSNRKQFLFKIITASFDTIQTSSSSSSSESLFTTEHINCMEKCLKIAKLWNLDGDLLRRFQLIQIYRNGYDNFGDEIFTLVQDLRKLGPDLLAIAAKRMSIYLATSPNYAQNITALTPTVTRYIESLDDKEWCAPSSLEGIVNLCIRSMSSIKDVTNNDYKIAEMLLDGCQSLQNC